MLIEAGVNTLIEFMTGNEGVKELSQKGEVSFDTLLDGILNAKDDVLDEQGMSEQTPAVFFQLLPADCPMDKSFEPVSFTPSFSEAPSVFNEKTDTTEPVLTLQAINETVFKPPFVAEMFQAEDAAIPSKEGIGTALEHTELKTNQRPELSSQATIQSILEEKRSQSALLFSMAQNPGNLNESRDEIKDDQQFLDVFKQNQTITSQTAQLLKPDLLSSDKPVEDLTVLTHQDLSASEKDAASFDQLLKNESRDEIKDNKPFSDVFKQNQTIASQTAQLLKPDLLPSDKPVDDSTAKDAASFDQLLESEPRREDALAASGKPQPLFAESMMPSLSSKSFQTRVQAKDAVMTDYQPTIEPKFMVDQSGSKASLRIHQKDIGEITAKIEMNQHSSSVTLIAENAEAKQILQGQLSHLKAIFSDSNITLTQANVEEQSSQQDHSQQGRKQAEHHQSGIGTTTIHNPDQKLITGRQQQTLIDTYV